MRRESFWRWLGLTALLLLVLLAAMLLFALFQAYQIPELLMDWQSLRYCA